MAKGENRQKLLNLFNKWKRDRKAPQELFEARVVPLYKKGDTDKAANYRPISLLSVFYKLYMIMIRTRIQKGLEPKICSTQFGFRPNKSTAQAVYFVRRLQDYAEAHTNKLHMAFLDWEKAFDKIQHDKLFIALERLDIPKEIIDIINDAYSDPTFFVKDNYGNSEKKRQSSGIRQGCPLSPYLFILVMTCIDHDIWLQRSMWVVNNRVPGINFDMIYYADDPIIFSTNTRALNELLKLTQEVLRTYGLKLNMGKCVGIQMNARTELRFPDRTELKREAETTYLGVDLNEDENVQTEVGKRLSDVR